MIGAYTPVREGEDFRIDDERWTVYEVVQPDVGEPQCFLKQVNGDKPRQYTEQFLLNGSGIERL